MSGLAGNLVFTILVCSFAMTATAPVINYPCHGRNNTDDGTHHYHNGLYTDELNAVPTVFVESLLHALAQPSPGDTELSFATPSSVSVVLPDMTIKFDVTASQWFPGAPDPDLAAPPPDRTKLKAPAPTPPPPPPTPPPMEASASAAEDCETELSRLLA